MTASCEVWLARDFLTRLAARRSAVWESPDVAVEPSGHRLLLPAECRCDPDVCPPPTTTGRIGAAA